MPDRVTGHIVKTENSGWFRQHGPASAEPILRLQGISKAFDATKALNSVDLELAPGEIVGLVGHNGAGKTTLVKIIAGLLPCDQGAIAIGGESMPPRYSVRDAHERGISIALQEISLCTDLRVDENVAIAHPGLISIGWRRRVRSLIEQRLSTIFPKHRISPAANVSRLSLAQRQMLQVALATITTGAPIRLLILDEPTSALPTEFAEGLFAYLRAVKRECGTSVLLVSHKMGDIVGNTDRTFVMRDGRVVAEHSGALSLDRIVESMGGAPPLETQAGGRATDGRLSGPSAERVASAAELLHIDRLDWKGLRHISLSVQAGQIVGLAGLEGNGQREILGAVWRVPKLGAFASRLRRAVRCNARVSYVSGDRQSEGIFPLWPLRENLTLSMLRNLTRFGILSLRAERQAASRWIERLGIKGTSETSVLALSGGTQQKVLLARGLANDPKLLLLDDPFRGVDVTTKMDAYRLLRSEVAKGKGVLWYTTENTELLECDVVYVLRGRAVAAVLSGDQITQDRIIASSFDRELKAGLQS